MASPAARAPSAPSPASRLPRRYRAAVASRALAALGGGYALASALAAAVAVHLQPLFSGSRSEATVAGVMLGFAAYAAAFMTAFATRSAWRAWAWVLGPALLLGATVLVPRWLG